MIKNNAKLDDQDKEGRTAMIHSLLNGHEQVAIACWSIFETDFSRKGILKRFTLDHTLPRSHFASCTEYATGNFAIQSCAAHSLIMYV